MKQEEKVLTRDVVKKLGLDKVNVITSDMIEGYTSIGDYAFSNLSSLTSIIIPNSVTSIGGSAFKFCYSLTSIILPNSVTIIGDMTFFYCSSLTSINIPNSITSIGRFAFGYCSSLTSLTFPNSVTSIGDEAFIGCPFLTSVTIHNSVTIIERYTLRKYRTFINAVIGDKTYETQEVVNGKCKAYKAFKVDLTCRDFQYEEGKTYEIDDEPELCKCGFHACLRLTDVFNYYDGDLGIDIVVHEVELEGVSDKRHEYDSKIVAKKITIGKRIL